MQFVLTEGSWLPGYGGQGSSVGGVSIRFPRLDFKPDLLDDVLIFVSQNPESTLIAMAPLPIVGSPISPQQILWRSTLLLAGIHTGTIRGDDRIVQEIQGTFGSYDLQLGDKSTWIGPGVEWFV